MLKPLLLLSSVTLFAAAVAPIPNLGSPLQETAQTTPAVKNPVKPTATPKPRPRKRTDSTVRCVTGTTETARRTWPPA